MIIQIIGVRRLAILITLILAMLAFVACGNDDGDGNPVFPGAGGADSDDSEPATDPDGDDGADDNGDAPPPDGDGPGSRRAVVTLDGETYEFDMSVICRSLGGAVGGSGYTADQAVEINIDIPPEDWETSDDQGWDPPSIRLTFDDASWHAGTDLVHFYEGLEGRSQVDSFSVDGSRAMGTVTFINMSQYQLSLAGGADDPEPVTGTFDVSC